MVLEGRREREILIWDTPSALSLASNFPQHPNNQPFLPPQLTHSLWFPDVYLPLYSLYASINDSSSFLAIKKIARDKTEKIANKRTGKIDIPYTYNERTNTDTKYNEITNNIINIAREWFYNHIVASSKDTTVQSGE